MELTRIPPYGARRSDDRRSNVPVGRGTDRRARLRAACGASLLALALFSPARAAVLTPGFDLGSRMDQSRAPLGARRDTLLALFSPSLGIRSGSDHTRLSLLGGSVFGYHPTPSIAGSASGDLSYDRISDRADGAFTSAWSERDSLMLAGRYLRSHDPLELGDWSSLVTSDVKQWGGQARAAAWHAEGGYQIDDWSYSAGLQPARMISWDAFALPFRGATDALLLGWREHSLNVGDVSRVRADMALAGYRRTLRPWAVLQLEAGGGRIRYSDGVVQDRPVFGVVLNNPEAQVGGLRPELHVWQDFATNVVVQVVRALGAGQVSLGWQSVGDFEGGIFRDPTYVRRAVAALRDTLGGATVAELEVSYGRTSPLHFAGQRVDIGRVTGALERRVRPWLSLRGASAYLDQSGAGVSALRRIRVELSLGAHAP